MTNEILSQDTYTFFITRIVQDTTKAYIWMLVDGTQELCYVLFKRDTDTLHELLASINQQIDGTDVNRIIDQLLYKNGICEVGVTSSLKETGKSYYRNDILGFKEAA